MDFLKCSTCQDEKAARLWIQVHGSFAGAQMSGQGPDFLSVLMPGPGLLKVEICLSCQTFKPCLEYTKEEQKAAKEYADKQDERAKTGADFGKLFGFM